MIFGFLAKAEPDLGKLEEAYRQSFLRNDANQMRSALPVYVVAIWLFAFVDVQLYGWSWILLLLFSLRVIVTTWAFWLNRFLLQVQSFRILDTYLLIWAAGVYFLSLAVSFARSTGVFYNPSISVLLVIVSYLVFPNPLVWRIAPALLFTFGEIFLALFFRIAKNPSEVRSTIITILLANVLGYILSIRLHTFRRNQFKAQHEAQLARAEIERLANVDPLTNIINRRRFLELANDQLKSVEPFALLYLDIDFFKQINDTHGHATGDLVLQEFANLVVSQIRTEDIFGRLGGEEFALLLPKASLGTAKEVAERIRVACQNMNIQAGSQVLRVTVSMGLTITQASDSSIDEILHRADSGLYQAKQLGRNRVEVTEGNYLLASTA